MTSTTLTIKGRRVARTINIPAEFPGTDAEVEANRQTHSFSYDEEMRCGSCDSRALSVSAGWPCGASVPRVWRYIFADGAEPRWLDVGGAAADRLLDAPVPFPEDANAPASPPVEDDHDPDVPVEPYGGTFTEADQTARDEWVVEMTHQGCAACTRNINKAITTAKVTGSVEASYSDHGYHAARVTRRELVTS